MSVILPPLWTSILKCRETLARLTPSWRVRQLADEIIERDRAQIRDCGRDLQDASGPDDACRPVNLSVIFDNGFYYVWLRPPFGMDCLSICLPFPYLFPQLIARKSKLRRDQIEYFERGRLEYDAPGVLF